MSTSTTLPGQPAGPLARRLPPQGSFRLGPFLVDEQGRLTASTLLQPPGFRFAWRDRPMQAALQDGTLSVSVALGRVPSTLDGAAQRPPAFDAVRALPEFLVPPWHLRLKANHEVALDWSTEAADPLSPVALVTGLTHFLLELAPYLDLLEESGIEGGTEST